MEIKLGAFQVCVKCHKEQPEAEFIKKRLECKKCVARERSRVCANRKYKRDALIAKLQAQQEREQITSAATLAKKRLNEVARVYRDLVAPYKARLRSLAYKQHSGAAPTSTMQKHQEVIDAYDEAYATQLDMIKDGFDPGYLLQHL